MIKTNIQYAELAKAGMKTAEMAQAIKLDVVQEYKTKKVALEKAVDELADIHSKKIAVKSNRLNAIIETAIANCKDDDLYTGFTRLTDSDKKDGLFSCEDGIDGILQKSCLNSYKNANLRMCIHGGVPFVGLTLVADDGELSWQGVSLESLYKGDSFSMKNFFTVMRKIADGKKVIDGLSMNMDKYLRNEGNRTPSAELKSACRFAGVDLNSLWLSSDSDNAEAELRIEVAGKILRDANNGGAENTSSHKMKACVHYLKLRQPSALFASQMKTDFFHDVWTEMEQETKVKEAEKAKKAEAKKAMAEAKKKAKEAKEAEKKAKQELAKNAKVSKQAKEAREKSEARKAKQEALELKCQELDKKDEKKGITKAAVFAFGTSFVVVDSSYDDAKALLEKIMASKQDVKVVTNTKAWARNLSFAGRKAEGFIVEVVCDEGRDFVAEFAEEKPVAEGEDIA